MHAIVFMGTPEWAVPSLRAVAGYRGARLAGVFTQAAKPAGRNRRVRPSAVQEAAAALGVPVVAPEKAGNAEALAALDAWRPALIVVCAYGRILPARVLEHPPLGCYNLHFSLLPRWRGASPVQAALLAGDAATGVSLQRMVKELDAGAIAAETTLPIAPEDTAGTLGARLAEAAARLIAEALPLLLAGGPPLREASAGVLPGTLLAEGWVPARAGFVRLLEVKPEGKRAMPCADFLRGQPQALGMRLTPEPETA